MTGVNRRAIQDRKGKGKIKNSRNDDFSEQTSNRKKSFDNDWNMEWFNPIGKQNDIVDSILGYRSEDGEIVEGKVFTIVDGSSGVGKTTTALHTALKLLKNNHVNQLIFAKNPTEVGDDKIGFLSGSETDKLQAHYDSTKRIFHEFIAVNKLENDINNGKIRLTIPNYLLGSTFDNAIVLIDEVQLMSTSTVKLLLERCGTNTRYVIMGDSKQRYAISKRNDGFTDIINKVTGDYQGSRESKSDLVGYVRLTSDENQRSLGSKFITKLYEDGELLE